MPTDIEWEDGKANINILCDGCDKEYIIMTENYCCGCILKINEKLIS